MPQEVYTTPGTHDFTVPDGVFELKVDVKGAGSPGNILGGHAAGVMSVVPGSRLQVIVGEQGKAHSNRQPGGETFGGGAAGGNGRGTGNGGNSGGGGSGIKQITAPPPANPLLWTSTGWGQLSYAAVVALAAAGGWWRIVAGGAGGKSGDSGDGGSGGANEGDNGHRGTSDNGGTVNATGGDQKNGGSGGKNKTAPDTYDGKDSTSGPLGVAGKGGQVPNGHSHGGGGGGGGWRGGGGGNASGGKSPGGGGGGGSNYIGGVVGTINTRGLGQTGNGRVQIDWTSPPPPHLPPPPPSDLKVDGVDLGSETTTRALTVVTFTATLSNPDGRETTQMVVRMVAADNDNTTEEWNFANYFSVATPWVGNVADGGDAIPVSVTVTGLTPNTKYYVRAYTLDSTGMWSQGMGDDPSQGGWSGGSFWTNRPPEPPRLLHPTENVQFEIVDNIVFEWTPIDADDDDAQTNWEIRTRRLTRPNEGVITDWVTVAGGATNQTSHTMLASSFTGNQFYLWSARTADKAGIWSPWSQANSFYVEAGTTPPEPLSPRRGDAVVGGNSSIFRWQFYDPTEGGVQVNADIRYRVVGTQEWVTFYGGTTPGPYPEWVFPLDTFIVGYNYEWQVRTKNSADLTSDWSTAETFWVVEEPGQGLAPRYVIPQYETIAPPLGCGNNRVFIFDRGGEVMRGEITDIAILRYHRKRDDITACNITVNGFTKDCGALLSEVRSWMHEIVVFRDGKRVWEGPIVRVTTSPNGVEIEAKDVMAYVYRRIMRQGYNDTYRKVLGIPQGGLSVVRRAAIITMNALAYDDPNVLRWLTEIRHSDDAIQHRAVPDMSKTAWEEIDDLAAHAGLDYTVLGRRIIFWDTHRAIGRLPEMRDEHFSEPVHVTEYGMQLANFFGVTNNNGIYGVATRGMALPSDPTGRPPYYGWVEQLVSAYGETEGETTNEMTEEARVSLEETLMAQAERGIAARWPTPLVVRVPDNATINPDVNLGFDQLVPGVWIPVRARATIREVSQWQKLDSVTVEQLPDTGEKIMVTLSPAPNGGNDPDADSAAEEA